MLVDIMGMDGQDRKEIIARRREYVGQLRARGLSIREIERVLPNLPEPIIGDDGKPWARATIGKDLKVLLKQWQAAAQENMGIHVAREFAEIQEAKREARQGKDIAAWTRLEALEMKLLGTETNKLELTGANGGPVVTKIIVEYADDGTDIQSAASSPA